MPARAASSWAANAMPRKSATAVRLAHSSRAMKAVSGPYTAPKAPLRPTYSASSQVAEIHSTRWTAEPKASQV